MGGGASANIADSPLLLGVRWLKIELSRSVAMVCYGDGKLKAMCPGSSQGHGSCKQTEQCGEVDDKSTNGRHEPRFILLRNPAFRLT